MAGEEEVSVAAAGVVVAAGTGTGAGEVSEGAPSALVVELQPGLIKITKITRAWMPATTPQILRIFIAKNMIVWGDG